MDNHIILNIVQEHQHYWSPQLNFRIEADEENKSKTIVSGLIGPKPNVWTMFTFIYFSIGLTGFVLTSYGISKYMLGEFTYLLFGLPIAALIMLSAYRIGKYGELLAKDQSEIMKQFIRDAINNS